MRRLHHRTHAAQLRIVDAGHIGLERVTPLPEAGTPDVDIPRVATEHAADMIVMGTRGLGAVGALLLGSNTQRMVHNATVPVLLVK